MFRIISRPAAVMALSLATLAFAACGESSQEKAKAQVCSARSEISKQIEKLQSLPISTSIITEAKASLQAIDTSVKKIKEAEPNLEPGVKEQVESGTKSFEVELASISAGIVTATKAGNLQSALTSAAPQIKSALTGLANSYKQAYASLKC